MTEEKAPPDPKQWRSWSKNQRQEHVHQFRIVTPQMRRLWDDFDTAVQLSRRMNLPEPYCQMLTGVTGTGKTSLVQMWREHVAPDVPSLYMIIPTSTSISEFITECLSALGDPEPWRGLTQQRAWRLVGMIKAAEKQIIFVDEVQHLIDKTGISAIPRGSEGILSLLFRINNDLNVPLVLIGLSEETQLLLQASPKLASCVPSPRILGPYAWDSSQPETVQDFRRILHVIDQSLPFDWSDLETEEMASRFFLASDGVLRQVMRLVRTAALQAIEEDASTLSLEGFAKAFEYAIANSFRGNKKPNPFREPLH